MSYPLRRPVIAGNWKLHCSPSETRAFFADFLARVPSSGDATLILCPPAVSLTTARDALEGRTDILLGVQNVYWEGRGAFTGEVSAPLAADAGAAVALVGHSERRHVFGETDAETALKVAAAIDAGLGAILCVGEKIEEREAGNATTVVDRQLGAIIADLPDDKVAALSVAYEPVWAIGTGRTATPEDAAEMHDHIRRGLVDRFGRQGDVIPLLYGGSVKPDNAAELLAASNVDGVLVGGASLDPASFAAIWAARP